MGAFHAGHLALMAASTAHDDITVVSLFVNPAQFGPVGRPGPLSARRGRRRGRGRGGRCRDPVRPSADEIYPPGFDTWVDPGTLATVLEGAVRPGHFRGVATVCTKLFDIVQPARAYFGRKDAQQVAVVKQVVRDLAMPLEIVACPTVRDPDGLALSSRNAYLSSDERARSLALPRALQAGLQAHREGGDPVAAAEEVLAAEPALTIDYVAVADLDGPTLAAAVRVGATRLIDNVRLDD